MDPLIQRNGPDSQSHSTIDIRSLLGRLCSVDARVNAGIRYGLAVEAMLFHGIRIGRRWFCGEFIGCKLTDRLGVVRMFGLEVVRMVELGVVRITVQVALIHAKQIGQRFVLPGCLRIPI